MSAYEPVLQTTALSLVQPSRKRTLRSAFVESIKLLVFRSWSCRHQQISRPFTSNGKTYRVCLHCGMHRDFDLNSWKMRGRYYSDTPRGASSVITGDVIRPVPVVYCRTKIKKKRW